MTNKKYSFYEYRDCTGSGSEEIFGSKEEAIKEAQREWDRLAKSDKKKYLEDKAAMFLVIPATYNEDGECWSADFDKNPVWDALDQ